MRAALNFGVFLSSFRYTVLHSLRFLNAGWFIGLYLLGPVSFLLTSWTIFQILGPYGSATFSSLSGFNDYVAFAAIGFAFQSLIMAAVWGGASGIRFEQQLGTLEMVLLTPSSRVAWLFGKIGGNLVTALIATMMILAGSFTAFPVSTSVRSDFITALVGGVLTLGGMTSFSFALAGLTVFVKKSEGIAQVMWPLIVFFSGLAFPVEALPEWGQTVASFFPVTYGIAIVRLGLLKGYSILDPAVLSSLAGLLILTAAYVPLGFISFRFFLKRAARNGALVGY